MNAVIDASALLAMLQDEPGGDRVVAALADAAISAVNISEVVAKLCDKGFAQDQARETLEMLSLNVVDFDHPQAIAAGGLRPSTRSFGLSLGDRACLALAAQRSATALTADRAWAQLEIGVSVDVIR
jgi:PIN domain nuclease of toxin-antitoxin system